LKQLIQAGIGVAIIVLIGFLGHDLFVYLNHHLGSNDHAQNVEVTLRNITEHDNFCVIEGDVANHAAKPVQSATVVLTYLDGNGNQIDSDNVIVRGIAPLESTYFLHEHVDPKGLIKFWKAHLDNVKF
ncbi:MAG: hypothetical protein JO333_18355, partial [Verrucomicrobia bacterium]|nr:hypothetical protein [Verrucomicrobiota bacterium]